MPFYVPLKNESLKAYSHTDDAHKAFSNAVTNGQARLALDILREFLDGLVEKIEELDAKVTLDQSTERVETTAKTASSRKVSKEPAPSKDEEEDKVPAEE